jgi:hypothetical protein
MSIELAPEFVQKCAEDDVSPRQVIERFIADLCA